MIVIPTGQEPVGIDLDEPGWKDRHQALLEGPGRWILGRRADSTPVLVMVVEEGDQPSYLSRTVGVVLLPPPETFGVDQETLTDAWQRSEVRAYSLGKVRADGRTERAWIMPNGAICIGDDVDVLGAEMAKVRLFAQLRSGQHGDHQEGSGQEGSGQDHQEGPGQEG